jgi:hypothetical protein
MPLVGVHVKQDDLKLNAANQLRRILGLMRDKLTGE